MEHSCPSCAPEQRGGRLATEPIALMRPVVVVAVQEPVERALQGCTTGEVSATEGHAPVLLENRALQPLDKAISPGMPGLGPSVPDPQRAARLIEGPFELR